MPNDISRTVTIDVPSDLRLGNETWRLCRWGKVGEEGGGVALVALCVPVIEGQIAGGPRDLSRDPYAFATMVGSLLAQEACCDRHAMQTARHIADQLVEYVRTQREFLRQRATGMPN